MSVTAVAQVPHTRVVRRAVSLWARLHRKALEAQLAAGADPWSSAGLMACAAELTSMQTRIKLADAIEGLITLAEEGRAVSPRVPMPRAEVLRERESLRDLADRLRAPAPVSVAGVARVAQFLWGAGSPVAGPECADGALHEALDGCWRVLTPARAG